MKGFILGAGVGKRLEPLSLELPAPMLPILNKPLILYILEHLKKFNIIEIKINLHHLPEQIDFFLQDSKYLDLKITYSLEKELLGTARAVKRVSSFIDDTVLIHYGNVLANIDILDFYNFHRHKKSLITYAVIQNQNTTDIPEIFFNHNFRIIKKRQRKKRVESLYIPAGIYLIEKEILDYIPINKKFDFDQELLDKICELQIKAYAYLVEGDYYKIQTNQDLLRINLDLISKLSKLENNLIFSVTSSEIHQSTLQNIHHPIMIGSNSVIKKEINFGGPCVIGNNVIIDEGTYISNSLILNDTYVGKNLSIENCIVYKNLCINTKTDFGVYVTDSFIISPVIKTSISEKLRKLSFRTIDIIFTLPALIILLPIFLLIAILIKVDSKGPVLYRSKRIRSPQIIKYGPNWYKYEPESSIYYYKFRTMYFDKSLNQIINHNIYKEGPFFKAKDDPRVTRIGKFLRKYSLDELPLLIYVLKGDLSLVGLWGLPQKEAELLYEKGLVTSWINIKETARMRFKGKLGLAGYWQSRGRSELSAEERIVHDTIQSITQIDNEQIKKSIGEYTKENSVKGYISLILDTVKSVLRGKGAY